MQASGLSDLALVQSERQNLKRGVYLSTEWIGSVMESSDELKDAKADSERISNGTASRRSIAEGFGRDYYKLCREIDAE